MPRFACQSFAGPAGRDAREIARRTKRCNFNRQDGGCARGGKCIPEITLLKNQMKSAMMAKPADKNIQSGNSRVKVTIYGQVNRAVRIAGTPARTVIENLDNSGSSTRFGLRAAGNLNKNTGISGWIEIEPAEAARFLNDNQLDPVGLFRLRHTVVSITNKDLGTLSLGHSGIAGSGGPFASFNRASFLFGPFGPGGDDGVTATATVRVANAAGNAIETISAEGKARHLITGGLGAQRENRILYRTPSLMGLSLEASYNEGKSYSVGFGFSGPPGVKGVNVAVNAGYKKDPSGTAKTPGPSSAYAVSGAVQHTASGLSVSGAYLQSKNETTNVKPTLWMAEAAWTGKANDMGATTLAAGYGVWNDGQLGSTTRYHLALNQEVDAAATDLYIGLSYDTGSVTHTVSAAEAATEFRPAVPASSGTAAVTALEPAASPCYTVSADGNTITKAAAGATCEVQREGVFIFVAGVRIKF